MQLRASANLSSMLFNRNTTSGNFSRLHAMSFDEIVGNNMVILGSCETVANAILELASQLDLMGLALIFKLGAMPYDMVERSMTAFGEDVVPRIRPVLDRDATANFAATTPALHFAYT